MKNILLISFILLSQLSFSQEDQSFVRFKDALADPSSVSRLIVNCNSAEAAKFTRNINQFTRVKSLRLEGGSSDTHWEKLFGSLGRLDSLTDLHFSYMEITSIPASFDSLRLQKMIISGCTGLSYSEAFTRLSQQPWLRTLKLDYNMLTSLPQEAASMKSIVSLTIDHNSGIDTEGMMTVLQQLPQLKAFALTSNELEALPSSISILTSLDKLDVCGNFLESLPSSIGQMKELDSLVMHDNLFTDLPAEAHKLSALKLSYISIDDGIEAKELATIQKKLPKAKIDVVEEQFQYAYTTANMPGKKAPVFHPNELVKPPLPELAQKPAIYGIDASQGGELTHPSGTRIFIPSDALVDAQGNAVSGKVYISYREFNNPLDVLLSGIPMTYDSGGVVNQFETAGMFEMYASQGDKELFIKPGAKIDIELASPDPAPSFNFYALNEGSKNWDYLGAGGKIAPRSTGVKVLSNAWRVFKTELPVNQRKDPKFFNEIFEDTSFIYTTKKEDIVKLGRKKPREHYFYKSSGVKLSMVKREKGDKKGVVKFAIKHVNKTSSKWAQFHNRVDVIDDYTFVYDGPLTASEFRKQFITKRRFNDFRVSYTNGSEHVTLEMKDHNGHEMIPATVYTPGEEKEIKQAKRVFPMRLKRYSFVLKREEKKFDREIDMAYRKAMKEASQEEKAMKKYDWIDYYRSVMANADKMSAASQDISRQLSITGFGVYNCDQIRRLQNPVKVLASYRTTQGEPLVAYTTYVIDKNIRGVLTYSGAYAGLKDSEIALDPKTTQAIMVLGADGSVGVMKGEALKGMNIRGGNVEFTVEKLSQGMSDVHELKKVLGMN